MDRYDVVIVGSGINSLVCAAELTAKGRKVLVLEREPVAGGCIKTAEATLPGYRHDLLSMSYPLFVTTPFYQTLKPMLDAQGVNLVQAAQPTGVVFPDGRYLILRQDRAANIAAFEVLHPGDGKAHDAAMKHVETNAELMFGLLGREPASIGAAKLVGQAVLRRGGSNMAQFASETMMTVRDWLDQSFESDLVKGLIAPWVLHVGLGPESAMSAAMARIVMFSLEMVGIPFVQGGSDKIVQAFTRIIEAGGGAVVTDCDVAGVIVKKGRATGVRLQNGKVYHARKGVACNVTPGQLYGRLLADTAVPPELATRAESYRFGRGCMQIHIALSAPPVWRSPELAEVGLIHLCDGMEGLSKSVGEAERGLLPAEPTIVVGQPAASDPSRCPPGSSLLWIQLQELPRHVRGDALGVVDVPGDGCWTDELAEAYAARIFERLRHHIVNYDDVFLKSHIMGPHTLQAANINLTGGDPYSGTCSVDQFHLMRPFAGASNHKTFVKGLYHMGASTHPGPGLAGTSGHLVAQAIG